MRCAKSRYPYAPPKLRHSRCRVKEFQKVVAQEQQMLRVTASRSGPLQPNRQPRHRGQRKAPLSLISV